jgi:general L-amino acid transport system substrate-binding protein
LKKFVPALVIGALILSASAVTAQDGGSILQKIQDRGKLVCGTHGSSPGMSALDADGNYVGMDADYCRALAAVTVGDPEAIEWVTLTGDARGPAIQTGEVDVIFRQTTNTTSRDAQWGNFGPTILYDGQGIMVRVDSGIETLEDLNGAEICVTTGTTTQQTLSEFGIVHTPKPFAESDELYGAYDQGACQAVTADRSQLLGRLGTMTGEHTILPFVLSKEPLGPVVPHGDDQWLDIVTWVVNATIEAEERGVTQANVADLVGSDNVVLRRLLGDEKELGSLLGLSNDFVVTVISAVGNYGEIYDRHFGPDALDLDRGPNNLWNNGGILYSPPFK